jgi:hypothetical protein
LQPSFSTKARPVRIVYLQPGQPERGWWQLLIVLAIGVWLFTWNNGSLPRRIPAQSAQLALQAQAQAEGNLSIFAYGEANLPGISSLPTAITIWLTGDPLRSIAWTGSVAAALTVLATWLLACELFRRRSTWQTDRSTHDTSNDNLEDDGHSPALWAALALVVSVPMIHFSRLPGQLEPLVCGLFALWSLLLGLRLGRLWGDCAERHLGWLHALDSLRGDFRSGVCGDLCIFVGWGVAAEARLDQPTVERCWRGRCIVLVWLPALYRNTTARRVGSSPPSC